MRYAALLCCLIFISKTGICQTLLKDKVKNNKGKLYIYWGWNEDWFTKSNINFTGDDYSFTLKKVIAKDRQSPFSIDGYFNPVKITIPQYNARIGFYIKEKWNISIGADHMKYVVQQNQTVKISGNITNSESIYDGNYNDENIIVSDDFLKFEHTDGLNFINLELRRSDEFFRYNFISINLTEGVGVAALIPRTDVTLLNQERYDEFHLSGYGFDALAGLGIHFFDRIFIQSEFKVGYINMPKVRTTNYIGDKASQSFFFSQLNIVFGASFRLNKNLN